jgi:hypothetical protein
MSRTSKKFDYPTFPGLFKCIALQELEAGRSPCASPDGPKTAPCGPEAVHASPSPLLARVEEPATQDTSGLSSSSLSSSAALQCALASRLQARLAGHGSPEYSLTWKEWPIAGQQPICALLASVLRTSGKDCSGWQTPRRRGDSGGSRWRIGNAKNLEDQARIFALNRGLAIEEVCQLSVSPTFYRRLMGFPEEWGSCGATATPLSHPSPRNSSEPT